MLVAVAPNRHPYGIDISLKQFPPGFGIADEDRGRGKKGKRNEGELIFAEMCLEVMDAQEMMTRVFKTDAHFVGYAMYGDDGPRPRQPRCNKDGVEWAEANLGKLLWTGLTFDIDNEDHRKWSSDEEARAFIQYVGELVPSAMAYATSAGCRVLQPIVSPLGVDKIEGALSGWFRELVRRGLSPDEKCLDWTRLFRAANVRREDTPKKWKPYRSPALKMTSSPIDPPIEATFAKRAPKGPKDPKYQSRELT